MHLLEAQFLLVLVMLKQGRSMREFKSGLRYHTIQPGQTKEVADLFGVSVGNF